MSRNALSLLRPSFFLSPFRVVRPTQIFGIFKNIIIITTQLNHFSLEIILQSNQVKRTPQDSMNWLFEQWIRLVVVRVTGVKSACVMSNEYLTRTSLYLVRLEIFEWIKLRHLHQFQENGAVRNFITATRVNSRLITHARMQRSIWNLQLIDYNNGFNFWIINSLLYSWRYAWPGLL